LHVYVLVNNNPVSLVDLLGLEEVRCAANGVYGTSGAGMQWKYVSYWHKAAANAPWEFKTFPVKFAAQVTRPDTQGKGKCSARVTVRVKLSLSTDPLDDLALTPYFNNPALFSTLKGQYAQAVENSWSKKFKICCRCDRCEDGWHVEAAVKYVDSDADYNVKVWRGDTGADTERWSVLQPSLTAHEFGHYVGNQDEYGWVSTTQPQPGAPLPGQQVGGNVMGNNATVLNVEKKHLTYAGSKLISLIQENASSWSAADWASRGWSGAASPWGAGCYLEESGKACKKE
jgi:hypothetical protein